MARSEQEQRDMIARYLALDIDQLYSLIPSHLSEYDNVRFSPPGQEDAGRRFLTRIQQSLQKAVCQKFNWDEKKSDAAFQDKVTAVAGIADVISGLTLGVPPFVVATIILKIGLNRFCQDEVPFEADLGEGEE